MGCGVSSGSQISPINAELPTDFKNGISQPVNGSQASSNKVSRPTSLNGCSRPRNHAGFNFSLFLPCRFYGTESPSLSNENMGYKQLCSTEMQTESDILGFKCQHSQTDSSLLTDEELDGMIEQLDKEIEKIQQECKHNTTWADVNGDDEVDEFMMNHKSWRSIIKTHKDNFENGKKFLNVAVQATRPKATSATQTKFGSIDHLFVPKTHILFSKSPQQFLEQSDFLTKTISENLLKAIEEPSTLSNGLDQHLSSLLKSFDDEDDVPNSPLPDGVSGIMVNSIHRTLSDYDPKNVDETVKVTADNETSQTASNNKDETVLVATEEKVRVKGGDKRSLWRHKRLIKQQKFQDCLNLLLENIRNKKTIEQLLPPTVPNLAKRDVSLQTTNDILTDEAPEYAARPPLCHKNEMIPSVLMFREIDRKIREAPVLESIHDIANYINKHAKNDLFKVRAIFVWITSNIKYNICENGNNMISSEILAKGEGVSKDYCQLFGDICRNVGIRVKKIEGFVRNYDYRPGYHFKPGGQDALESWNAVYLLSSWRLIDLTLASGYTDGSGTFHRRLNEHYFLTDPNVMIWTHFPYSDLENEYDRWQLLDKPLKLEDFNSLPKVTEYFFEYNLSIRSKLQNPLEFRISSEVKIGSHEAMRYKYKLYPAEEVENASLNHYVFCQLKEDKLVGSFMVTPPLKGRFQLKIFAKPEREMHGSQQDLSVSLNPVISMLLECDKARKYIEPFPINDLPWGPTQKFYDYKLKLINQKGPIIVTWGGRRRLVMEANETMLLTYSLFDSESMEMDARSIISREDTGLKTTFIINPPRVGTFKFMLFGMPKPKQKGKWRLPLLATFMIDCKLTKPTQHVEDMTSVQVSVPDDNKGDKKQKGKK